MNGSIEKILGKKVGGVRVVPLVTKIITLFVLFLLVAGFATNYINLLLNRGEQVKLMNRLLVKDLKDLYVFTSNQHEIYTYNNDYEGAVNSIVEKALRELKGDRSIAMGVKDDGTVMFIASKTVRMDVFEDGKALAMLKSSKTETGGEGSFNFNHRGKEYFGLYKYNAKWDIYLVRAEELDEFYEDSRSIFRKISYIIILIVVVCTVLGIFIIRFVLRYVQNITNEIMSMQESQKIGLIDLSSAPNDDVTYLGMAFNSLANTIDNLMTIFRKFVTRDVVLKAYKEREVRLEGSSQDLAILFSDIKGFTYMTETLGTDIIQLLNIHYNRAIKQIHDHDGIIGSIIGDALLALFGTIQESKGNKSHHAVSAAYEIQEVASQLREEMHQRKEEIVKKKGALTQMEENIYKAVLLQVGVGIDGGDVFYGNVGSNERMTNTAIGDNVNAASRLEGLTRIYKVPVICSKYVKDEVEKETGDFLFLEIDQVQVKGKTLAKRVFWPVPKTNIDDDFKRDMELFSSALQLYYKGKWKEALGMFERCTLPLAEVFRMRTKGYQCPKDWSGVWTMKTK